MLLLILEIPKTLKEEIPNEEPVEEVTEEPAEMQDDFDIKITDENIDLHLIGERQNEQEE